MTATMATAPTTLPVIAPVLNPLVFPADASVVGLGWVESETPVVGAPVVAVGAAVVGGGAAFVGGEAAVIVSTGAGEGEGSGEGSGGGAIVGSEGGDGAATTAAAMGKRFEVDEGMVGFIIVNRPE